MLSDYGVTDTGYELLQKTGLDKRIEKNWGKIYELIPRTAFIEDWEIEEVLKNKKLPHVRKRAIERWLKETGEYDRKPEDFFVISGTATDAILAEEERNNFRNFGIEDLSQLDGLLAAYCLTKHLDEPSSRKHYIWRSKGLRTSIYGDIHGDLQIRQVQTELKDNQKTIYGTQVLHLFGKLEHSHINADYCYWPVLAATALKYADTIEAKIPEVENWQDFMKQYGWDEKIVDPSGPQGIGYNDFVYDYSTNIIAQIPDKIDTVVVKKMLFGQMRPNASQDTLYLPVMDAEQRLVICTHHRSMKLEDGEIKVGMYQMQMPFRKSIIIAKEDVAHLFKGAVHGIMTNQSRTIPHYLAFMLWQYDQIKAGKSIDKIREDGYRFKGY